MSRKMSKPCSTFSAVQPYECSRNLRNGNSRSKYRMHLLNWGTALQAAEQREPIQHPAEQELKFNEFSYTEQMTSRTCLVTFQPNLACRCKRDARHAFTTGLISKQTGVQKNPRGYNTGSSWHLSANSASLTIPEGASCVRSPTPQSMSRSRFF